MEALVRDEMLFEMHNLPKLKEDLENGVRRSGQGLNQETNLKRPGDTRWDHIMGLFST